VRSRADHRRCGAQLFRLGWPAGRRAGIAGGRPKSRLPVPAELSGPGGRGFTRALLLDLVRHRADAPLLVSAGLSPKCERWGAATENPTLVRAFGINVPRMITLTYGFGVALAAFAGVMAAPIYNVSPQMGSELIIVVFAVVVIGGMGSILGAILTGFGLGVIE